MKSYSVFDNLSILGYQLTPTARLHILGAGNTPTTFSGDGLVQSSSSVFHSLDGFAGVFVPRATTAAGIQLAGRIVHTEEPMQVADLNAQLHALVPSWFP